MQFLDGAIVVSASDLVGFVACDHLVSLPLFGHVTSLNVAVAAAMFAFGASEASAWVCRADGVGSRGFGRANFIADAKLIALRKCERRSPVPVCTITWCR